MIFDVALSCITSGRSFESCNKPSFTSLKQNQSSKVDNFTEWQPYYTHPLISCTHVCICVSAHSRERGGSFLILLGMRSDLSSLTLNCYSLTPHTHSHRHTDVQLEISGIMMSENNNILVNRAGTFRLKRICSLTF